VTAIKLRDPEGHPLELLEFPSGSNSSWNGRGIMGIDHTAISVADVRTSLRFYEGHGLTQGSRTINQGPKQDALDGFDGVEVDVVPMNPAEKPPHVELLSYRFPIGRQHDPFAANDIAATRIVWRSERDALVRDPDGHLLQLIR
jgi:catechol 2,3-dioxygenase-like lactoylglutathione lyase family enzyme